MISKLIVKCELDVMPSTIHSDDCSNYIYTQHIHTLRTTHILTDILVHTTSIAFETLHYIRFKAFSIDAISCELRSSCCNKVE